MLQDLKRLALLRRVRQRDAAVGRRRQEAELDASDARFTYEFRHTQDGHHKVRACGLSGVAHSMCASRRNYVCCGSQFGPICV